MRLATLETSLSADPILAALADYRGSVIDLDQGRIHGPASLARDHESLTAALRAQGLKSGDRVVLAVANGPVFFTLFTAILAAGGSPLLLHVKTPPLELRRTAMRFGAAWIAADGWSSAEMAAANLNGILLVPAVAPGCLLHEVDQTSSDFDISYPNLAALPLHPTSGTTGVPKVAVRPGSAAVAEARHYIDTIGIDAGDSIFAATPMSHAYAFGMAFVVPLLSGCKVITSASFDAAATRRSLAEKQATILPAVPALLDLLTFGAGDRLRNSVRAVLSAGAPLPERTARRVFDCLGLHVRPLFGTTETGGISVGPDGGGPPPAGYVGPSMSGVETEIRDETSLPLAEEVLGRLHVRSPSMMAGYLSPGGIDASPLSDGWFLTGDLATRDRLGNLYLRGRHSEVINVGGLKVIPCEVEEVIAALPAVAEAKVYAGHDRKGRQFVKAAVVLEPPADAKAVQEHCDRHLVYYKRPRTIVVLDRLPRTASGKIVVSELP